MKRKIIEAKLQVYYDLHDDFEVLLRKIQRAGLSGTEMGARAWQGHDALERMVINEQSKLQEDALFHE